MAKCFIFRWCVAGLLKFPKNILMALSTDAARSLQKCSTSRSMFRLLCAKSNLISLNQLFKGGLINHHKRQFLLCPLVPGLGYGQFLTMQFTARRIRKPLFTSCTCHLLKHLKKKSFDGSILHFSGSASQNNPPPLPKKSLYLQKLGYLAFCLQPPCRILPWFLRRQNPR